MAQARFRVLAVNPQGTVTMQDLSAAGSGGRHGAEVAGAAQFTFVAAQEDLDYFRGRQGRNVRATFEDADDDTQAPEAQAQATPSTTGPRMAPPPAARGTGPGPNAPAPGTPAGAPVAAPGSVGPAAPGAPGAPAGPTAPGAPGGPPAP
jgi:hypothetical protein